MQRLHSSRSISPLSLTGVVHGVNYTSTAAKSTIVDSCRRNDDERRPLSCPVAGDAENVPASLVFRAGSRATRWANRPTTRIAPAAALLEDIAHVRPCGVRTLVDAPAP